jgi:cytoskeletal protein CcmA (bactofilin family)
MPTKREVICPECGASSSVTGKVELWVCNICRHRMKLQDLALPPEEWEGEIEVGGTVIIPAGAVCKGGSITANDIVLQGEMAGVELYACRKLTIGANAKPDWVRMKNLDLELGVGVNLTPGKPVLGRHLALHGKFAGTAILEGTLTVFADGDFSGELRAAGLSVEEGGGLRAKLDVNPENAPPPPKPRKRQDASSKLSKSRPPPPSRAKDTPAPESKPKAPGPEPSTPAKPRKKTPPKKKS